MIPPPTPEDVAHDPERDYETSGLATGWCGNPELRSWIRLCVAARASAMVSDTQCEWLLAKCEWLQAENERLRAVAANADPSNGECITECRQLLAAVGIERTFFDDCVTAAAEEIKRLRAQAHKWGTGLCSAHTPPDPECRICNVWLVFDELVDENVAARTADLEAEVAKLRAIIDQHDLCHNLHGKVDARAFADGCAAEQRKLYGCAPDQDEIGRLRTAIKLQQAMRRGTVPWYEVSEADVDGWVTAAAERMREREAAK